MLFWHKHNIEKSLADLPNFTPFPDEWTVEDKVLFEQAFSFHGKSFHRIQQMVKAAVAETVYVVMEMMLGEAVAGAHGPQVFPDSICTRVQLKRPIMLIYLNC